MGKSRNGRIPRITEDIVNKIIGKIDIAKKREEKAKKKKEETGR